MTKIAIISQAEQGVLIDVGGCTNVNEATQHLTSTLQVQSQFWENQPVDVNIGPLALAQDEMSQVLSIFAEVGLKPRHFFAQNEQTQTSLEAHNIALAGTTPEEAQAKVQEATVDCTPTAECAEAQAATSESAEGTAESADRKEGEDGTTSSAPEKPAPPPVPHVLYLRQTLRSGQAVSHKGHLVIIGDVNPGAEVSAEGDIHIWGALRGIAHAGTAGNTNAEIRALRFEPIQLRIAHAIARSPDRKIGSQKFTGPETARIVNGTIRISSSAPE